MELSEAVAKAADDVVMPVMGMAITPSGLRFLESSLEGGNYEYREELKPLIEKWSNSVGKRITEKAAELGEFSEAGLVTDTYNDDDQITKQFDNIFETVATDIACGVFALGYQLGDPRWDCQPHDRKTFHSALADRETQQLLHARFKNEYFLRERFSNLIKTGGEVMSRAFSTIQMPHTKENVHEWGKLAVVVCFYDAFQIGLKSRRIWEEDMTFTQIARGLED